jgi:hypothetical protein
LHTFFLRIRAPRGHQVAAVATARKMAVLAWHLLAKETDYLWARPALVAHKLRALELQAGRPMQKGNQWARLCLQRQGAARRWRFAEQAERAYEHFVAQWQPKPTTQRRATNPAARSRGAPRQPG